MCLRLTTQSGGCRWSVNFGCFLITALLGEWLCVQRELQDIPLGKRAHLQATLLL